MCSWCVAVCNEYHNALTPLLSLTHDCFREKHVFLYPILCNLTAIRLSTNNTIARKISKFRSVRQHITKKRRNFEIFKAAVLIII